MQCCFPFCVAGTSLLDDDTPALTSLDVGAGCSVPVTAVLHVNDESAERRCGGVLFGRQEGEYRLEVRSGAPLLRSSKVKVLQLMCIGR